MLTRPVELPAVALRHRDKAVKFGLQQWTPFEADEVFVTTRPIHRAGATAAIELKIITRRSVKELEQQLTQYGISVDELSLAGPSRLFTTIVVNGRKRRHRRLASIVDLGLLVSALVLVAAVFATALSHANSELNREKSVLQRAIQTQQIAANELKQIEQLAARRSFLAERLASEASFADTVSGLMRILPDGVQVDAISWEKNALHLSLSGSVGATLAWKQPPPGNIQAVTDKSSARLQWEWVVPNPAEAFR